MNLSLWKPRTHLPTFWDDFFKDVEEHETTFTPPVDIVEQKDQFVLKADIPGMEQKDIKVELKEGVLSISGERKFEKEEERGNCYRKEVSYGRFKRSFIVDGVVEEEKIEAKYRNGQLILNLPKTKQSIERDTPKQIPVS